MWTLDFFLGGDMKNKMGDDEGAGWGQSGMGNKTRECEQGKHD